MADKTNFKKCDEGLHYYDANAFSFCPHCEGATGDASGGAQGIGGGETDGETQGFDVSTKTVGAGGDPYAGGTKTVGIGMGPGESPQPSVAPNRDGLTIAVSEKQLGFKPVTGWLVCVSGANQGRDYRIMAGMNTVARQDSATIPIMNDTGISRKGHAQIIYDDLRNEFLINQDGQGEVVMNGEKIWSITPLPPFAKLELGNSEFIFVPFCGSQFQWPLRKTETD